MKIFAISDIHGNIKSLKKVSSNITEADLVTISGDLTRYGTRKEAAWIISHIEKLNNNILAVHGNKDKIEVNEFLEEKGYSIHRKCRKINDINFFGVGGSSPTPMNTPTEYSEETIMKFLEEGFCNVDRSKKNILISHAPPRGIRDRTFFGLRGGSRSIKKFLINNTIDLCLVGHIHEASGVEEYHKVGIVANTGSFRRGKYLSVNINENIDVKQCRA